MELGLKGKIALVTGSSRGIGRGVALALAAEGCDVMLTGRDEKALDEVAAAIRKQGRRAAVAVMDLRGKDAPAKLIEQVKRELGGLDILVNNAVPPNAATSSIPPTPTRKTATRLNHRPGAAHARRVAPAQGAARLADRHRRHRRAHADRRVRHRLFRQCGGGRLLQMHGRSRQA